MSQINQEMRFGNPHQESEWQEQDEEEAGRVFSSGSFLLDFYGEKPPAVGQILVSFSAPGSLC